VSLDNLNEPRLLHLPDPATSTVLVFDAAHPGSIKPSRNRIWGHLLTGLLSSSLDRRLAQGVPPESNRLLAARAQLLVSAPMRFALARDWRNVVAQAHKAPVMRDPRGRLNRRGVAACQWEIEQAIDALLVPLPVPVRGAAVLSWLLRDGTGPLYAQRCSVDLRKVLSDAIAALDPETPLD
jgi:hypothetical protein